MVSIHDRDREIEDRLVPGHWEGDLMMGSRNQSALGTLVERTTRFTMLIPLVFKDSDYVTISFANKINNFPKRLRKSMTYG
jgi:IS30 family transposase